MTSLQMPPRNRIQWGHGKMIKRKKSYMHIAYRVQPHKLTLAI